MSTITFGYVPVETVTEGRRKDTLIAPADHTVDGVPSGKYHAGDEVSPFDMSRAHLRAIATEHTPSGKISAAAQVAAKELGRNKTNRAHKGLAVKALRDAGLLD